MRGKETIDNFDRFCHVQVAEGVYQSSQRAALRQGMSLTLTGGHFLLPECDEVLLQMQKSKFE